VCGPVKAIHHGHLIIGDDQVGRLLLDSVERRGAIGRLGDGRLGPGACNQARQDHAKVLVVVDDQDVG